MLFSEILKDSAIHMEAYYYVTITYTTPTTGSAGNTGFVWH